MPEQATADFGLPNPGKMRVVTLNLFGQQAAWAERKPVLADELLRIRPDVVAFQETITGDHYDQVAELLSPDFYVAHQSVGLLGDGNHGVSLASRWPLTAVHEPDQRVTPRTASYPCGTLIAEIGAPEPVGPFLFVNHGPSYQRGAERERELQAVTAGRLVEKLLGGRKLHVILAGDFNATADASSVRFWAGEQSLDGFSVSYQDAWTVLHPDIPGETFTPDNPLTLNDEPNLKRGRRIDYVFVRCDDHGPTLEIVACSRVFDQPVEGVWPSDHFGVLADLAVPKR